MSYFGTFPPTPTITPRHSYKGEGCVRHASAFQCVDRLIFDLDPVLNLDLNTESGFALFGVSLCLMGMVLVCEVSWGEVSSSTLFCRFCQVQVGCITQKGRNVDTI